MAKDGRWVLFEAAAYLRGRGITFGSPLVPQEAVTNQVYSVTVGLGKAQGVVGIDQDFSIFADRSLDHIVVSPMIAATTSPAKVIKELAAKLKMKGHLIVVTNVGEQGQGIKEMYPNQVEEWVASAGKWVRKTIQEKDGRSLLIYKRIEGSKGIMTPTPPKTKRVCIARYGALGDAIALTPLIKHLKEEGYHVTLNINPYCGPVFENNPNIDNILVQEKDMIPNVMLGDYWGYWTSRYDKYINLSESMEGDLIFVEGRPGFYTSKEFRHKVANKNYYDYIFERAGYPTIKGKNGELFFTKAEERKAQEFFSTLKDKFVIVWALNGSSHHKVFPMMEPLLKEWFKKYQDTVVITVGDVMAQLMEFPHPQLLPRAGKWSIRESLIAAKYANLVIGPETMMTNAAAALGTPEIVFLSHSTKENLTKYWPKAHALEPAVPCYPCHQLHYTKESCPVGEMYDKNTGETLGQAPICSMGISPVIVLNTMEHEYNLWKGVSIAA